MLQRRGRDHEVKRPLPRALALALEQRTDFRTSPRDCRRDRENLGGTEKGVELPPRLLRVGVLDHTLACLKVGQDADGKPVRGEFSQEEPRPRVAREVRTQYGGVEEV